MKSLAFNFAKYHAIFAAAFVVVFRMSAEVMAEPAALPNV